MPDTNLQTRTHGNDVTRVTMQGGFLRHASNGMPDTNLQTRTHGNDVTRVTMQGEIYVAGVRFGTSRD